MFNERGEVVGIVSRILSKSGGFEGIGFAVAINPARRILLESSSFWTGSCRTVRGLFSASQIARRLGVPVHVNDAVRTFTEIEMLLNHEHFSARTSSFLKNKLAV